MAILSLVFSPLVSLAVDELPLPTEAEKTSVVNLILASEEANSATATITDARAEYMRAKITYIKTGTEGSGLAKKSGAEWQVIYQGDGKEMCEAIASHNFPADMVPECGEKKEENSNTDGVDYPSAADTEILKDLNTPQDGKVYDFYISAPSTSTHVYGWYILEGQQSSEENWRAGFLAVKNNGTWEVVHKFASQEEDYCAPAKKYDFPERMRDLCSESIEKGETPLPETEENIIDTYEEAVTEVDNAYTQVDLMDDELWGLEGEELATDEIIQCVNDFEAITWGGDDYLYEYEFDTDFWNSEYQGPLADTWQKCWDLIDAAWYSQDPEVWVNDRIEELDQMRTQVEYFSGQILEHENESIGQLAIDALDLIDKLDSVFTDILYYLTDGPNYNYEAAIDLIDNQYDPMRNDLNTIIPDLEYYLDVVITEEDYKFLWQQIQDARTVLDEKASSSKIAKNTINTCYDLLTEGEDLHNEAIDHLSYKEVDLFNDTEYAIDDWASEVEDTCDFLFEEEELSSANVDGYVEDVYKGKNKDEMADVMNLVADAIAREVMQKLMTMDPKVLDALLASAGKEYADDTASLISALNMVPDKHQDELVEQKKSVMEEMKKLEEARKALETENASLKDELKKLKELENKIAGNTFYGDSAKEITGEIKDLKENITELSEKDLQKKVADLDKKTDEAVKESQKEQYKDGVVPFTDVKLTDWYAPSVAEMKDEGIVKGYTDKETQKSTGEFGATDTLTVGAILKMAIEAVESEKVSAAEGNDHWAEPYKKIATEKYGVKVSKGLDDKVTRSEVAEMLVKIGGLLLSDDKEAHCPDVSADDTYFAVWQTVYNNKIMQGDNGGTGTCRGNDNLNRAEASKVVEKLLDLKKKEETKKVAEKERTQKEEEKKDVPPPLEGTKK